MSVALTSAISGLNAAETRFDNAARQTVQAAAQQATAAQRVSTVKPGGIAAPAGLHQVDLLESVTDLKAAETGYKAAAKVLSLIADTEDSLLDILS